MTLRGERLLITALFSIALFFGISTSGDYWHDHWSGKWAVLLAALSLFMGYRLSKTIHWSVGILFSILLASGIKSFGWNFIAPDAAYTSFVLVMFALFFSSLSARSEESLLFFFGLVFGSSALYTMAQFNFEPYYRAAFSGNASMNGCLIAVTLPLFIHAVATAVRVDALDILFWTGCAWATALIAILMTNTSIPLGVLGVVTITYIYSSLRSLKVTFAGMSAFILQAAFFAWACDHKSFFSSSGRFYFWRRILDWWASSHRYAFGMGTGSGRIIFENTFERENLNAGFALSDTMKWAHNDYVQLLFENGIVGLLAALVVTFFALKRSFDRPWLFSAVAGYAAMSFFNYPAHLPIHAFLGASLIWLAHKGAHVKNSV